MFEQIVQPNLTVAGQSDLCLAYVTTIFNVPEKYNTATDAWNAAQYKHVGDPPTNVSVPVWFSWTGTINGVTANYGHVACSVNGSQFYSVSAQGDKIFPSLQALMDFIGGGIEYLGWSEDINNTRVVEEEDMYTEDQLTVYYQAIAPGQPVNQGWVSGWVGQPINSTTLDNMLNSLWDNPDIQAYRKTLQVGTTPTVVVNGTTYVPQ